MGLSSLFGKKKDQGKEPAKKAKGSSTLHDMDASESMPSSTSKGLQPTPGFAGNARDLAKETAKKIDQIESEMSREHSQAKAGARADVKQQPAAASGSSVAASVATNTTFPRVNTVSGTPGNARPPHVPHGTPKPQQTFIGMGTTTPSVGQSTDILLGDSMLSNAIELSDSITNPAIEEAAILFAYGESASAIDVLVESIREGGPNHGNPQAWLMALELYQAMGKKAEFENSAIDFALRFETSSPTWSDDGLDYSGSGSQTLSPTTLSGPMAVLLSGPLDVSIVPKLDHLKQLTPKHHRLHIDFSQITSAHGDGAELILRMLSAFAKSNHVLVVHGAEHLLAVLQSSVVVGQSDTPKSLWILLLDVYRLLGRQAEFEEKSIDYCVTYEVSPPSWEPYPANIKRDDLTTIIDTVTIVAQQHDLPADTIALSGELLGKAENDLALLANFASSLNHVVIDCSALKRVDFSAAGALLNWAVTQQSANKTVEFRKVGHLVSALFIVMGIHEVAQIERR